MGIHPGSRGGDDGRYTAGESGGSGGSGGRGRSTEIPQLDLYPDEPLYDLATIVLMVGVRPMTLWAWEQQLGIPFLPGARSGRATNPEGDDGPNARRYSERDLIALLWLRERIVDGAQPHEAAALLMNGQRSSHSGFLRPDTSSAGMERGRPGAPDGSLGSSATGRASYATPQSGSLTPSGRPRIQTGPLREGYHSPSSGPIGRSAPITRRLADLHGEKEAINAAADVFFAEPESSAPSSHTPTHPKPPAPHPTPQAQPGSVPAWLAEAAPGGADPSRADARPPTNGPLTARTGGVGSRPLSSAEHSWTGQLRPSSSLAEQASRQSSPSLPPLASGQLAPNSPSLPGGDASAYSGGYPSIRNSPPSSANDRLWMGPTATSTSGRELRASVAPLIRTFAAFDTLGANRILREALTSHTVESICVALLAPALARLSDLQTRSEVTPPEEQFGVNYVRGFLYSVFHQTPERSRAPLVVVGCGPKDVADINALLLAVFWRRAGARVAFLGQDVDANSLVKEVDRLRPALIALSVSTSQRVRALTRMAKAIEQLPAPRPIFAYCGLAFTRNPELQRKVNGVYLGDDAGVATWHLRRLLNLESPTR